MSPRRALPLVLALGLLVGLPLPSHAGKRADKKELLAKAEAIAAAIELEKLALNKLYDAQAGNPEAHARAVAFIDQALERHPSPPYSMHQTRALILGSQKDPAAVPSFVAALETYLARPPATPDLDLLMTAYTSVSFTTVVVGDLEAAEQLLGLGRQVAEHVGATPGAQVSSVDFDLLEVDLLQRRGAGRSEILDHLDQVLSEHPDSGFAWLLKGDLLGQEDPVASRAALTKALEHGADELIVHFALGSTYINESLPLRLRANEMEDLDESRAVAEQADALAAEAKPHFERVLELDPDNLEMVNQLMTIALQSDDMEAFARWKAEKERLEAGR